MPPKSFTKSCPNPVFCLISKFIVFVVLVLLLAVLADSLGYASLCPASLHFFTSTIYSIRYVFFLPFFALAIAGSSMAWSLAQHSGSPFLLQSAKPKMFYFFLFFFCTGD